MRIFSQTILESSFTNEFKSRVECHKQAEMCQLMSHFEFQNPITEAVNPELSGSYYELGNYKLKRLFKPREASKG